MIPKRRKAPSFGLRETPQIRCVGHLTWVRGHCCAIQDKAGHTCNGKIEAAHVRTGTDGGMSVKPSDTWTIPLCGEGHREQHLIGEPAFERRYAINMKKIAAELATKSPHRRRWEPTNDC